MTADLLLPRVQSIVHAIAGPDRTPDDAGPDTPLGEEGYWLDSIDVLEVILACEREFGVVFESGAELSADTLLSPRRLAALIASKAVT
jgi:acyl carrier protein